MNLLVADPLPPLAAALAEEPRSTVLAAARGQRVRLLASLLGHPEGDVLATMAREAGLDVASDLQADRASLRLLPARLVHDYQIVPIQLGAALAES